MEILTIDPAQRKDPATRRKLLNEADVAFLCLPDDAARESVVLVTNPNTRIIDASTAHRTDPDWVYGLPELNPGQREKIRNATRIAVPGCHATGFNMLLHPLVSGGIIPQDYPITSFSIAGYSGGGKKMIAQYQAADKDSKLEIPRFYALKLDHKHLPEMQKVAGLLFPPMFNPVVGDFYQGEVVAILLFPRLLLQQTSAAAIREFLAAYYEAERFVTVMPYEADSNLDNGFLSAIECNGFQPD